CFYLLMTFIRYEFSYDKYNEKADRIYRIANKGAIAGQIMDAAVSVRAMAPTLMREESGVIENAVRLELISFRTDFTLSSEDKSFNVAQGYYSDPSVFEIFSFNLIMGDKKSVLAAQNSIVISQSLARKFFGSENPIGKILRVNNGQEYAVTGMFQDMPDNSHFNSSFFIPFPPENSLSPEAYWGNYNTYTYVLLRPEIKAEELQKEILSFKIKHYQELIRGSGVALTPYVQPLLSIHLHSNLLGEPGSNYSIDNVYIFSAIAFVILLIAFFNYFNLTTARSEIRSKEITMKKILGASKRQLFGQFIFESVFYILLSTVLSLTLIQSVLPVFNMFISRSLVFDYSLIYVSALCSLFLGIIAGIFPAAYFTSFEAAAALRKEPLLKGKSKFTFRNAFTLAQFAITIAMIVGTLVVYKQLSYLNNKNLGYNKNNILIVPVTDRGFRNNFEDVKNMFRKVNGVVNCSASSCCPGETSYGISVYTPEGGSSAPMFQMLEADADFLDVYGIKLSSGRNFYKNSQSDYLEAFLINQKAAEKFGREYPINKDLINGDDRMTVIGVVEDFNLGSLHKTIEPLVIRLAPSIFKYLSIKIKTNNIQKTITDIGRQYKEIYPNAQFQYTLLDDKLNALYLDDIKLGKAALLFSGISLSLSLLGLIGLVSFTAERKSKENSIRKILGAGIEQIYFQDIKEYMIMIAIASVIAFPVMYYVMNAWLGDYAYHTDMGVLPFIAGGALTLIAVIASVTYHIVRSSKGSLTKYLCER
ncbi:MAG TPA: ABC transporter permease, partial [Ignavibacteriales bacterium]|nr:ABC transporter permease [Ignavibacteriales bacterium]